MQLEFFPFQPEYFPIYKKWFADSWLNQQLGPMDEEWLEAVLQETDGCEYAVFHESEMIAVTGIKYPSLACPYYLITDLSVNPALRGRAFGRAVLNQLMDSYKTNKPVEWRTYVQVDNPVALQFFEKNGWIKLSPEVPEDDMYSLHKIIG